MCIRDSIYPYLGTYGAGDTVNRFFPSLGNHDWYTTNAQPYLDYFTLPGNERYYNFVKGNVNFFVIDSDSNEPDGRDSNSVQALWLKNALKNSSSDFNIVYFHHPPYSLGSHNSDTETELIQMRTNIVPILENKKVDLVLSGHSHSYERSMMIKGHYGVESTFNAATMAVNSGSGIFPASYTKSSPSFNGTVYTVVGVSGQLGSTSPGWPHNAMYSSSAQVYGSLVIDVLGDRMDCKFLTYTGSVFDQFTIQKTGTPSPTLRSEMIDQNVPIADPMSVFPNPVRDYLTIDYNLNKASRVQIDVLDLSGRLVYEVADEMEQPEGRNQIYFPVRDANLPKGIYIIRLMTDEGTQSRRVVID